MKLLYQYCVSHLINYSSFEITLVKWIHWITFILRRQSRSIKTRSINCNIINHNLQIWFFYHMFLYSYNHSKYHSFPSETKCQWDIWQPWRTYERFLGINPLKTWNERCHKITWRMERNCWRKRNWRENQRRRVKKWWITQFSATILHCSQCTDERLIKR